MAKHALKKCPTQAVHKFHLDLNKIKSHIYIYIYIYVEHIQNTYTNTQHLF